VHAPFPSVLVIFEQLAPCSLHRVWLLPIMDGRFESTGLLETPCSTWYGPFTPDPPPTSVWRRIIFGTTSAPVSAAFERLYRR
jgi:hypothetical protein